MTKRLAINAGLWSALDVVLRQGVLFVVSLILARLLLPEDFGVIALVTFFTSLSIIFVQGGLTAALIQRQETTREEESAVFWWNLAGSIAFSVLLIAAGPLLSSFYGYPVLRMLTWVAAAQVVLSALGAVQTALLTRQLRFDQLTKIGVLASLGGGAIGVVGALMGFGVWALAAQMTGLALFSTVATWLVSDWRPSSHFQLKTIRHLMGFGGWVGLGSMLEVFYSQGFALLIGKLYGARDLGLYNRAVGTQLLPSSILSSVIGRVAFPLFSSRGDDPPALRRGLAMATGISMLFNLPIMMGLAMLSDLVIEVLFGRNWLASAPALSALAIAGILLPMHSINMQMILAQGDGGVFIRNEIIKKSLGIACVIVGSLFGIFGLACSQIAYSILAFFLNAQPARRALNYGAVNQLLDLKGIFFTSAAMVAVLVPLKHSMSSTSPAVALLVLVTAGGVVFVGLGWLARVRAFKDLLAMLPAGRGGGRLLRWLQPNH